MENIGTFEKKVKELLFITLEGAKASSIAKKDEVSQADGLIFVGNPIKIDINLYFKSIKVYHENYSDLAKEFKKNYEGHTKEEWILHEWYE